MIGLPILVHGAQISALVVGGGRVATRKVAALLDAGARVRVVATVTGAELRALAASGARLTIVARSYEPGDVGDAELVFAATDDPAVNRVVAAEARLFHRLVSVADDGDAGSFRGMAAHRSGELVVAVATGGVPGAAARIRDAAAQAFGPEFGDAVQSLGALRERLLESGQRARWLAAAGALLGPDFCDVVRSGTFPARMAEWR